jgi:hypothetical protein
MQIVNPMIKTFTDHSNDEYRKTKQLRNKHKNQTLDFNKYGKWPFPIAKLKHRGKKEPTRGEYCSTQKNAFNLDWKKCKYLYLT